jgi:hypothetical protein
MTWWRLIIGTENTMSRTSSISGREMDGDGAREGRLAAFAATSRSEPDVFSH